MKSYCKRLVIDKNQVEAAYAAWRKAQAGRKNHPRIIEEHGSVENLVEEICEEIQSRTLKFPAIRRYHRREPTNGKIRLIGIQSVKQQVCDYLVVSLIDEFLQARLGFYQASSMPGKGSLFVAKQLKRWAQTEKFFVQVDVKQCYPSIGHDKVMKVLRKHIRSFDVLYVAETLLSSYDKGLEIGSFFSLKMAQLILSYPYHFVASMGKMRRGKHVALVNKQVWYMDDAVLMSRSKRDLKMAVKRLEKYLQEQFGLHLKPWKISKVGDQEPINVAGFLIRPKRVTIRGRTFLKIRKTFRAFSRAPSLKKARSVCAYWGWLLHSDSRATVQANHFDVFFRWAKQMISSNAREQNV